MGKPWRNAWWRLYNADPSTDRKPKNSASFSGAVDPPCLIDIEDFFEYEKLSFENMSEDRCGITVALWPECPSHFIGD